jgi:zinc transporter, ZIP family
MSLNELAARFNNLGPVAQAVTAGIGTWALTGLGAAGVLGVRRVSQRPLDVMLGFAGGVMVAASCWSLLIPAMERGGAIRAAVGLLVGAGTLFAFDKALPHLHPQARPTTGPEGPETSWDRSVLLVVAITLHNIPEGLALGVAFAGSSPSAAAALAVGIGLQNVPEGLAVSMPLRREGLSRWRALWFGQLSAIVEPIAAGLGAWAVLAMRSMLPYALAFAAGAMLFVVVDELIPETVRGGDTDVGTLGFVVGSR